MPRTPTVSNDEIVKKLKKRRGKPATAADLGVATARMKNVPGVVQAGTTSTGERGRPALLFALAE